MGQTLGQGVSSGTSASMWPLQHGGSGLQRGCQVDGIDIHGLDLDVT